MAVYKRLSRVSPMAKVKKAKKKFVAHDRPSADQVPVDEFIVKNILLAPELKRSLDREETPEEMLKHLPWLTPLDILEVTANDPRIHVKYRLDAAKAAAPYKHKKMPVEMQHKGTLTLAQIVAESSDPDT